MSSAHLRPRVTPVPSPGPTRQGDTLDWRTCGACVEMDPDLFFPEPDEPADEALAACGGCPVRRRCLASALVSRELYGVWGGTTEQDRRRPLGQAAPTALARQDGAAA